MDDTREMIFTTGFVGDLDKVIGAPVKDANGRTIGKVIGLYGNNISVAIEKDSILDLSKHQLVKSYSFKAVDDGKEA